VRGVEHRLDIQRPTAAPIGAVVRLGLFELAHLAGRARARMVAPRLLQLKLLTSNKPPGLVGVGTEPAPDRLRLPLIAMNVQ
jgi:hypothetical protein